MTSLRLAPLLASVVLLAPTSHVAAPAAAASPAGERAVAHAGPDSDGDGLPDDGDGCPTVASSNPTGCPSASRRVSLTWLKGERRLQARVTSPVKACSARAKITLWRERADRDEKVVASIASHDGRRRFAGRGGARYHVTVSLAYSSGVAECGAATSRTVRVPR
ncbi:hypothetical protein SAMN04489844_2384 [Nocardioides exalbidus]|uniref:Ig-like domain-containing protein n=1 Tax=Nocardioides exalbidus TaxID=402596 RepID=A0A1H4SWP1_9ACTN|nr:hypothetical protein [Nocardioides exalbidus]SEC48556.1 hypothetical protein SAMN04489844_2384 [Nocardioides exalbidus]